MARKIVDIIPLVTARPNEGPLVTDMGRAERDAERTIERLRGALGKNFDFTTSFETEAQCEHCRGAWTEDSSVYNGGCCGKDEANSPERLKELRDLAEVVADGTYYRYHEGRRDGVAINWPDTLGVAIQVWLEAGRPESEVDRLLALGKRVQASEWCTLWQDPGPSGCSLARLPDRVTCDESPNQLVGELCSLLNDMDLLPATKAVA